MFCIAFVLVLSISMCDGQPLSDHKISQEAARIEQRVLASIRSIMPQLCLSDSCGSEKHLYRESMSAIEETIQRLTTKVDVLQRQVYKLPKDMPTCTRLFESLKDNANVHVFEGRCYLYVRQEMTWSRAQERCQLVGANLVSVMSKKLNDFIGSLINRITWIGGKRASEGHEFSWVENGQQLKDIYTNWRPGQPGVDVGNCVYIRNGQWYDYVCSRTYPFICEL